MRTSASLSLPVMYLSIRSISAASVSIQKR
jgi:hypothetical protein